jgi:hypothetical protein
MHAQARIRTMVSTLFVVDARSGRRAHSTQPRNCRQSAQRSIAKALLTRNIQAKFDPGLPPGGLLFLADDIQVC